MPWRKEIRAQKERERHLFKRIKDRRIKAAALRREAERMRLEADKLDEAATTFDTVANIDAKLIGRDFDPYGPDGIQDA